MRITFSRTPVAALQVLFAVFAVLAAFAAVGVHAAPAVAAVLETPNACKFTYDNEYRNQGIELTATAPADAAVGQALTLTGERLQVNLRAQLATDAAVAGLIASSPAGTQTTIVTKTWLAIRATNTSEGTQVIGPLTVPATTTAYYDEAGQTITATPFAYTPPTLPDTTWTATGGDIAFSQAGPAAITAAKGQLPVGPGGVGATVGGSAVIQANLPNDVNFYMDCQPGDTIVSRPQAGAGISFTPLVAGPLTNVAVAGAPSNPAGTPPKPTAATTAATGTGTTPSGQIISTKLIAKAGKVPLRVKCPTSGPDCAATAHLRTRTPIRTTTTRRPAIIALTRAQRYTLPAGRTRTLNLALSTAAKTLLRARRAHNARATLTPTNGPAAARNLTLKRG